MNLQLNGIFFTKYLSWIKNSLSLNDNFIKGKKIGDLSVSNKNLIRFHLFQ